MPDTADHRAEMFSLAHQRRAAGLPLWERTVNLREVFHNEEMTFEQRRDAIVRILRASPWLAGRGEFDALVEIVDLLADACDAEEFDGWWSELYDHADYDRVWIATF
jgi:hypothetical protein